MVIFLLKNVLNINQTFLTCQQSSRQKSCRSFHRWRKSKLWGKTKIFHQPVLRPETFWSRSWLWKFVERSERCWPPRFDNRTEHSPSRLQTPQQSDSYWAPVVWFLCNFLNYFVKIISFLINNLIGTEFFNTDICSNGYAEI